MEGFITSKGEKMILKGGDDRKLHAELFTSNGDSKTSRLIIMCHGLGGGRTEKGRFYEAAETFTKNGYDVILFDFAGAGDNEREPILLSKWIEDLENVYGYARSIGYNNIATIGLSMGGLTSLLADLPDRKAAVFWAPAFYPSKLTSFGERLLIGLIKLFKPGYIYKKEPSSPDKRKLLIPLKLMDELKEVDTDTALSRLHIPVLIVQGSVDKVVNARLNIEAVNKIPEECNAEVAVIDGAGHDFGGEYTRKFIEVTLKWLNKYF